MRMVALERHLASMVDEWRVELKMMIVEKLMWVVEEVDSMLEKDFLPVEITMANRSKVVALNYSALEIEV